MNMIWIQAKWDGEAGVWVATSEDVPGFVTEAQSLEELYRLTPNLLRDLGAPTTRFAIALDGYEESKKGRKK